MTALRAGLRHRGHSTLVPLPLQSQTPLPPCPGTPSSTRLPQNHRILGAGSSAWCSVPISATHKCHECQGLAQSSSWSRNPTVPTAPPEPPAQPCVSCAVAQQQQHGYSPENNNSFSSTEKNAVKTWPVRQERNPSE